MSRVYSFSRIISGALSASRPVQKSAISGSVSRTWSRGLASTAPRSSSSRAFLLEDPGVGLAEHERLSELSSPARWRHAQEVEIARKEKELERAAQALKDGTGALQGQRRTFSYSMAPVKAMYDRAAARKAARRSNWPQLPDGETLMEPVWTAYGNFKALGGFLFTLTVCLHMGSSTDYYS